MSKKQYAVTNLDCAHCAAKIESAIQAYPGVTDAQLVFATRTLTVTAADPDTLLPALQKLADEIEPGVVLTQKAQKKEQGTSPATLLIGSALFALGILLQAVSLPLGWYLSCYIASYLCLGLSVLCDAGKHLLRGKVLDENFLMSIATLGAFAIGEYPEAVGVMLFCRVGSFFEEKAVNKSRKQITDAADLRPEQVTLWENGQSRPVPPDTVTPGQQLLISPGERIGLDGRVLDGESQIDTAPITGEPLPVEVSAGDKVLSGCINLTGRLILEVEKPLGESMVTRILQAVESAAAGKPKLQRFITRFSSVYTPVVVGIALLTAVLPACFDGRWEHWVYTALSFLVMSCPCALVLSIPLAYFSGIGKASKQGILFKSGLSMEALANVKAAALDKTGTVTKGQFSVRSVTNRQTLELAAACEQGSSHPIAQSILSYAESQGIRPAFTEQMQELSGYGVQCILEGKTILCGSRKLMDRFSVPVTEPGDLFVARDNTLVGAICLTDTPKDTASKAVSRLHKMGVTTAMLTGDTAAAAEEAAAKTGIRQVFSGLLPHQKPEVLLSLRKQYGSALFVGDGINDAPVLAGADVGGAMGSGADAAIEVADVVYLKSDPLAIPASIAIARKTKRIAMENVIFALGIKALVMVLGLAGLASMWLAVFADSGVAMLCVLNSIRLLYRKNI